MIMECDQELIGGVDIMVKHIPDSDQDPHLKDQSPGVDIEIVINKESNHIPH